MIGAILSSYEKLDKLEKLREIRYVYCSNEFELDKTKRKHKKGYEKIYLSGATENQLKNYLMTQRLFDQKSLQDLRHKLYVPRLERVKWENKINTKDLEEIRKELIAISNMSIEERRNIAREKKKYTLFDAMYYLDFDYDSNNEGEDILMDSRPFESGGIKYYVKRKELILDK